MARNLFSFDAQTETPETLAERRARAALVAGQIGQGAPSYGGGIGDLLKGLGVGLSRYRTDKAQREGEASGRSAMDDFLDIMAQPQAQPMTTPGNDAVRESLKTGIATGTVPPLATYTPPGPQNAGQPEGRPRPYSAPPMADVAEMEPEEAPMPAPVVQSGPAQPAGPDRKVMAQMVAILRNPWVPEADKALVRERYNELLKKSDPMYQMGLEKAQLELEAMRNPKPDITDDIKEYNYYTQQARVAGQRPVDFYTWQKSKSPMGQAGGEVGSIPPGFELFTDAQGNRSMRPITGGPAAVEAAQARATAEKAVMNRRTSADIVTQDIDRAIAAVDAPGWLPKTGFGAETLKGYGGTGAADLAGLLSSVEANIGFDALQQMRAASPTGGALGSITERELALLAATKGAITQSQSAGQLKDNLNRLWNVTQDIVHGANAGPPRRKLGFQSRPESIGLPPGWSQEEFDVLTPEEKRELTGQ